MRFVLKLIRTALVTTTLGVCALLAYRGLAQNQSPTAVLRELAGRTSGHPVDDVRQTAAQVARPSGPEIRVLFLGNSLTSTAGMPGTLERLAWTAGVNLTAVQHAPGGWFLSQHATAHEVERHLAAGGWSALVLQEQSDLPAAAEEVVTARMFPAARVLAARGRAGSPGLRVFVYETFAHRDGDATLARFGGDEAGTYGGMQERINASYERLAIELNATIAPVGHAWARMRQLQPNRALYADPTHPNDAGAYLVACVFLASITGRTPAGNPYHGALDDESAGYLQEIAARTVLRANWARTR